MRKTFISALGAALAVALVAALGATDASAQRYGTLSKKEVKKIIKDLETESDIYRRSLDQHLDDSKIDGSDRETRYNSRMKEFEKAVDELKGQFDSDDGFKRAQAKVEEMVRAANPVNEFMRREAFNPTLQTRWRNIRTNINRLARNYNLKPLPARRVAPPVAMPK